MANSVPKDFATVHGQNPMHLVEKIVRTRILDSQYWKEHCFALTAETVIDKATDLDHYGGHYTGNIKATPFLCLILKLLQLQPEKEIVIEYIKNEDFKYLRLLGCFYLRLTGTSIEIYKYLEPLYDDFRKVRFKNRKGKLVESHIDDVVDKLLNEERVCDLILPRLCKREILEQTGQLEPRQSALDDDLDDLDILETYQKEVLDINNGKDESYLHRKGYVDLDDPKQNFNPDCITNNGNELIRRKRSESYKKSEPSQDKHHSEKSHRKHYNRKSSSRSSNHESKDNRHKSSKRRGHSRSLSPKRRHSDENTEKRSKEVELGDEFPKTLSISSSDESSSSSDGNRKRKKNKNKLVFKKDLEKKSKKRKENINSGVEKKTSHPKHKDSLSVEDSNSLRAKLGLAPLKDSDSKRKT